MQHNNYIRGFTIPELLISIFIVSIIAVTATTFERDVFSLNTHLQSGLNAQLDARHVIKVMVAELRQMAPSSLGAYPIALANSTAVTFYSDVDKDGLQDRVRYFMSGTALKKGVTAPTGSPLTYNVANEKLTILVDHVVNGATPVFQYYPSTYDGTSAPLTDPVDVPSIRLVKITVMINPDPIHSPTPLTVTSEVSLRNLKDNL